MVHRFWRSIRHCLAPPTWAPHWNSPLTISWKFSQQQAASPTNTECPAKTLRNSDTVQSSDTASASAAAAALSSSFDTVRHNFDTGTSCDTAVGTAGTETRFDTVDFDIERTTGRGTWQSVEDTARDNLMSYTGHYKATTQAAREIVLVIVRRRSSGIKS